jgi:hypothetical protein
MTSSVAVAVLVLAFEISKSFSMSGFSNERLMRRTQQWLVIRRVSAERSEVVMSMPVAKPNSGPI